MQCSVFNIRAYFISDTWYTATISAYGIACIVYNEDGDDSNSNRRRNGTKGEEKTKKENEDEG